MTTVSRLIAAPDRGNAGTGRPSKAQPRPNAARTCEKRPLRQPKVVPPLDGLSMSAAFVYHDEP